MWRGTLRIRSSTARFAIPCSRKRCTSRSRVRADDRLGAVAKPQPAGAKAAQLPERHVRDVDVEDQSAFQGLAQQLADQQSRHSGPGVEMPAALRPGAKRDGDGGQTEEPPF